MVLLYIAIANVYCIYIRNRTTVREEFVRDTVRNFQEVWFSFRQYLKNQWHTMDYPHSVFQHKRVVPYTLNIP